MGIPHALMRARCRYCGRPLRYANIPNRGPVMAHAKGDGEYCRRLQASGNDIQSRQARAVLDSITAFARRIDWIMRVRRNTK